jgi:hypothetical protein
MRAHSLFYKAPNQQRDQKNQTQRFNALGPFEKQRIDNLVIVEKTKVLLDPVLLFIGP